MEGNNIDLERLLKKVKQDAFENMSWNKSRNTNLYVEEKIYKKDSIIQARNQKIPIKEDSVYVFADDAPNYNWAHPCRYLLYDTKNGDQYDEVKAYFPPYLVKKPKTFNTFYQPIIFEKEMIARAPLRFD